MDGFLHLIGTHGLWIVFLTTLAARVGLPLPAAPLLVVAGGLAVSEQISMTAVLLIAVIANVMGDGVWFYAGRAYGAKVMRLLCRVSLSPDSCVRQSESLISRWGGSSLIAAKFVPGVSVVAAPMAGALGMSVPRFLFYGALSGLLWSVAYLGLGLIFSDQIQQVLIGMANAGGVATAIVVILVLAFIAWRYWRRATFLRSIEMSRITVDELYELIEAGADPLLIDVRSEAGVTMDGSYIPGALNISLNDLSRRVRELPRDREIVVYCNCPNDATAARAARILASHGLTRVRPLQGGIDAWISAGREIVVVEFAA